VNSVLGDRESRRAWPTIARGATVGPAVGQSRQGQGLTDLQEAAGSCRSTASQGTQKKESPRARSASCAKGCRLKSEGRGEATEPEGEDHNRGHDLDP